MHYLTKEWYRKSWQTDLHHDLEENPRAATFDEDFYQEMYEQKEEQFLAEQLELYNEDPRTWLETENSPFDEEFLEGLAEEDIIELEDTGWIEEAIEAFDNRPPFSEADHRIYFSDLAEASQKMITNLPSEIQSQIADPRVFGLGIVSPTVYKQIRNFCLENARYVEKVLQECEEALISQAIPAEIRKEFLFHDCQIVGMEKGKDLTIRFDCSGGFCDANSVTFKDVSIQLDENIEGSYWLNDEIYAIEDGYEVHVMVDKENEDLAELILTCKDIEIG